MGSKKYYKMETPEASSEEDSSQDERPLNHFTLGRGFWHDLLSANDTSDNSENIVHPKTKINAIQALSMPPKKKNNRKPAAKRVIFSEKEEPKLSKKGNNPVAQKKGPTEDKTKISLLTPKGSKRVYRRSSEDYIIRSHPGEVIRGKTTKPKKSQTSTTEISVSQIINIKQQGQWLVGTYVDEVSDQSLVRAVCNICNTTRVFKVKAMMKQKMCCRKCCDQSPKTTEIIRQKMSRKYPEFECIISKGYTKLYSSQHIKLKCKKCGWINKHKLVEKKFFGCELCYNSDLLAKNSTKWFDEVGRQEKSSLTVGFDGLNVVAGYCQKNNTVYLPWLQMNCETDFDNYKHPAPPHILETRYTKKEIQKAAQRAGHEIIIREF